MNTKELIADIMERLEGLEALITKEADESDEEKVSRLISKSQNQRKQNVAGGSSLLRNRP